MTPEQARTEAKKLLGAVALGSDPIAERRAARTVPMFRDVAAEYLRTHVRAKCKPNTIKDYEVLFRLHIMPAIGNMPVTEIRRVHVSKLHASLADRPITANRALTVVKAILNWMAAERDDIEMPSNPCRGINRNPEQSRERFLSGEELARLGDALADLEPRFEPHPIAAGWRQRCLLAEPCFRLVSCTATNAGAIRSYGTRWN